jgi:protease I
MRTATAGYDEGIRMMELNGKRVAILADNVYQEMELWYPLYRLREAGAKVDVIAAEAGKTYTSKLGYPVKSDHAYATVDAVSYDGVIIPGGFAPDHMRRHEKACQFVADFDRAGKLVAAICHGPWMMCSADILRGRRATSFFAIRTDVANAGADWVDAEVVIDRNLVTSRKPEDLPAFMRACIAVLAAV